MLISTRGLRRMLAAAWLPVVLVWANCAPAATPESPEESLPSVTVIAPRPPTPQELAGEAVHDFVQMHARVVAVTGQLARWRTPICPVIEGLPKALTEFVSARILAIAANVGAPYQKEETCKGRHNVYVFFTAEPAKLLDNLEKQDARLLGFHYLDESKNLKKITRPIQGFYVTASRGVKGIANIDEAYPVLPLYETTLTQMGKHPPGEPGSRLTSHISSEIVNAIILVDVNKMVGQPIGPISDYLAVLALTQALSPEQCGTLPSILDLMAPSCSGREAPTSITSGDLAFLKGLYRADMELVVGMEQSTIADQMWDQFKERHASR